MGNCQAIDAAALVIQYPSGKIERFYWPLPASEVMRLNPGHYVSLIIPLPPATSDAAAVSGDQLNNQNDNNKKIVQFTRVKLLRPSDTLALGHAYRLVTTQEVMKVLRAKKQAKMKRQPPESLEKHQTVLEKQNSDWPANKPRDKDKEKDHQATKHERNRPRTPSINSTVLRSKSWRPTLQSISEAAS